MTAKIVAAEKLATLFAALLLDVGAFVTGGVLQVPAGFPPIGFSPAKAKAPKNFKVTCVSTSGKPFLNVVNILK